LGEAEGAESLLREAESTARAMQARFFLDQIARLRPSEPAAASGG
jgi:hypothetical protein